MIETVKGPQLREGGGREEGGGRGRGKGSAGQMLVDFEEEGGEGPAASLLSPGEGGESGRIRERRREKLAER